TTPTYTGTAVVIGKANPQDMVSAPGEPYYNIEVPWSVRVTYDGEFIHDAYWNGQLGQANLSHGCTNLSPANAKWYYHFSVIGDPVTWTNTPTSHPVPLCDAYGAWNLSRASYQQGGLLLLVLSGNTGTLLSFDEVRSEKKQPARPAAGSSARAKAAAFRAAERARERRRRILLAAAAVVVVAAVGGG